jgi:hypothetical protein
MFTKLPYPLTSQVLPAKVMLEIVVVDELAAVTLTGRKVSGSSIPGSISAIIIRNV